MDSGWLGLVQQEKAICLVQDNPQAHLEDARRYIENALYLCREYRIRDYAAALNRAGRIHVLRKDYTQAFKSFEEGIEMAEAAQDNWFLMANCAEHAELAFNRWYETKDPNYQSKLMQHKELIEAREETGNLLSAICSAVGIWLGDTQPGLEAFSIMTVENWKTQLSNGKKLSMNMLLVFP